MKLFSKLSDSHQDRKEARSREFLEWRESIRKPCWCECFQDRYIAAIYFDSWEGERPIYVFDAQSGKEIGSRYLPLANYSDPRNHSAYREEAERIIHQFENWKPVPLCDGPLRPKEEE